jgi:lipoate---protein ligase
MCQEGIMTPDMRWHGEYKVPGGKLIVADLTVARGQLCNVELSGDFFLEPDETLERMVAAVEGAPFETPAAELAARLREATQGAVMLGVTPEDFAIAIRRAVETAGGYAG